MNTESPQILTKPEMVRAFFVNKSQADQAFDALIIKGYVPKDIHIVMTGETHNNHFVDTAQTDSQKRSSIEEAEIGTAIGSSIGITVGAVAGVSLALGASLVIPGIGLLIAGPLVAGLPGAGTVGIAGGLIGALMGVGISEERVEHAELELKKGEIIISVLPKSIEDGVSIKNEWHSLGATDIEPKKIE